MTATPLTASAARAGFLATVRHASPHALIGG